jgi:hypothetical protein
MGKGLAVVGLPRNMGVYNPNIKVVTDFHVSFRNRYYHVLMRADAPERVLHPNGKFSLRLAIPCNSR